MQTDPPALGGTPGTGSELQPINMVRVSVDGRELRSVIRSEVSRALPAPVGVA